MFLAVVMACSLVAEDDCIIFKDTRGFHMTTESCMTRVYEMIEDLKENKQLLFEIELLPDRQNRFLFKCDDETGIKV